MIVLDLLQKQKGVYKKFLVLIDFIQELKPLVKREEISGSSYRRNNGLILHCCLSSVMKHLTFGSTGLMLADVLCLP
ncbi:MAG: hypothetical protein COY74_06095 [Nitrosopumilales archaeon CG_4_10_14_0_8_um_filter_34_8]|nr:MAG: hypothetical protein COY74_06095 [Nitrosopumilales archaeon CG_4_10_14_0_8_um_filter_34_8]